MDYRARYESWLTAPEADDATKAELLAIGSDEKEIEERFYKDLEFGTAGLRGIIGAGTNRMNIYVVQRATQGLSDYLLSVPGGKEAGVCIAYDSRRYSDVFAKETAAVLAANGIKTYLFSTLHAVPQLSAAVQHLKCMAGVVITASHNPKKYNGYKVYWANGGQCTPDQAGAIYACMERVLAFGAKTCDFDAAVLTGAIMMIGEQEDAYYYQQTQKLLLCPELLKEKGKELAIVYTPLHGSGNIPVRTMLSRVGVTNVFVVPEQELPDPDFPTVTAPNPEDPAAFVLARALAERVGATVCIATDPDSDRLGLAVKTQDGDWKVLTGNEIACILLEHILFERKKQGTLPDNGVVVKSIVSSRLADAIAEKYGAAMEDVLTGFRFISEKIDRYAKTGEKTFLFGFEESFGFLPGGLSRDKDAICAAMFVAEACVCYNERGMTLYDALHEIYEKYGFYKERGKSYTLEGKAGMEKIGHAMQALRREPCTTLGGYGVVSTADYAAGTVCYTDGRMESIDLPSSDVICFTLENGAWAIARPSGTEPKLKIYIGANEKTEKALDALLDTLFSALDARLTALLS